MITRLLAILLLSLPVLEAQSQPPAPSVGKPSSDQQQAAEPIQNDSNQKPGPPTSVFNQQTTKQDGAKEDQAATQYNWSAISAILTFAVGVLQFWVMRRQANIADTQNKITRRQSRMMKTQTKHMEQGLVETCKAAEAAKISADVAKQALVISNRAYVHVVAFELRPWGQNWPTFWVSLKNTGHLPATITGWKSAAMGRPLPHVPDNSNVIFYPSEGVIFPNGVMELKADVVVGSDWTNDNWQSLRNGKAHFSAWGVIFYSTGFQDVEGETGFGFHYDPSSPKETYGQRFADTDARGYNYTK